MTNLLSRIKTYKAQHLRLIKENADLKRQIKEPKSILPLEGKYKDDEGFEQFQREYDAELSFMDESGVSPIEFAARVILRLAERVAELGPDHPLASTFGCMKDEPLWDDLMRDEPTVSLRSSRLALAQAVIEMAAKAVEEIDGHYVAADDPDGIAFYKRGRRDGYRYAADVIRNLSVSAIAGDPRAEAYRDCLRLVRDEQADSNSTKDATDEAYNLALAHAMGAILGRAAELGIDMYPGAEGNEE
jgi:hypothetical protein